MRYACVLSGFRCALFCARFSGAESEAAGFLFGHQHVGVAYLGFHMNPLRQGIPKASIRYPQKKATTHHVTLMNSMLFDHHLPV